MQNHTSKKSALIVATLSAFVTPFVISSVNVALPSIERDLRVNAVTLTWVATSYLLAAAVSLVPFGKLADIYGRKKIFAWGMFVLTLASLLAAASTSVSMLIALRVVQGVGAAMIFATGMAILTSVFPPGERGRALGINVAAVYIGLSLGPFVGGFLTQHLTWRSVFAFIVPIGLASIYLIVTKLKGEWAEARGERFDVLGSVIYSLSLIAVMYGISAIPAPRSLWLIPAGFLGLAAFVRWELKTAHPVFELSLFRSNRGFAFSNLAALINYSATFAVSFLLSLYLQYIKGLSPQGAGLVLVLQPLVQAVFSPLAGRLSDRIEPRTVASAGMVFTAAGLFLLVFLTETTGLKFILAVLAVLGFGFALFSSPNMNAIMGSVEKRFYGLASGSVGTMRLLGQMLSMGIATLIFSVFIGRVQITATSQPALLTSLKVAFSVFGALCCGGIFASLARGRMGAGAEFPAQVKD